ncbi:MAG: hypothetical protein JW734_02755 [Candidatus Omnitrophica bacterium]|nr:hypothetical protein [Candidatus Omnitrophota bacterium]
MKNNVINLEIGSAQQLEEKLTPLAKKKKWPLVALSIPNPQVVTGQFDLPQLSLSELRESLKLEAVSLLSLNPSQTEIDYQILSVSEKRINGVFAASSAKLIREYAAICYKKKTIPVSATAAILTTVNSFLEKNKIPDENFCLLDFSTEAVLRLAVFDNSKCILLREILYDSLDEARKKILGSLKYSYTKGRSKKITKIYLCPYSSEKDELIDRLKAELDAEIETSRPMNSDFHAYNADKFFKINLLRKHALSLGLRRAVLGLLNIIITASLIIVLVSVSDMLKTEKTIRRNYEYLASEQYQQAKALKEKLEKLTREN